MLRAYGENAATFLIFQAMAMKPNAISALLLPNLRSFRDGRTTKWSETNPQELWLFPNFGKRHGFGEPDVLLIAGGHVFWIEVETTIDAKSGCSKLKNSLLQLWRFRSFQEAIYKGIESRDGRRHVVGDTLRNARESRRAQVIVRGHGVLQKILYKLRRARIANNHHYVLFTVNKPRGEGIKGLGYSQVLTRELNEMSDANTSHLPRLDLDSCWYAYWKGGIEAKFNESGDSKFILEDSYVRIKNN